MEELQVCKFPVEHSYSTTCKNFVLLGGAHCIHDGGGGGSDAFTPSVFLGSRDLPPIFLGLKVCLIK